MGLIDDEFEKKVLACLSKSTEFSQIATHHINPSYFTGDLRHNIAKIFADFFKTYGTVISEYAFSEIIISLAKNKTIPMSDASTYGKFFKELMAIDISDYKYVLDQLINFIKNREWKALIELSVKKYMPANDFLEIERKAQKIAAISANGGAQPYFFWGDTEIETRTKRRLEEKKMKRIGISTGIKKMDDTLHKGGWFQKELYLILAPPKRGKSSALYWFANAATWQGFNVPLFSCENSTEVIEDRIDALNTNIEIKKLTDNIKLVESKMKTGRPSGKLIIFEYPSNTLTNSEIDRQIRRLEVEYGIRSHMAVVDYLGIMRAEVQRDDRLQEEGEIGRGLRGIASKWAIPVLSADQVNRGGSDKAIITGKDIRGTWDKVADADTIITLSATPDELKKNQIRIHFSESRNNPPATFTIGTSYNFGKFYREFLRDED